MCSSLDYYRKNHVWPIDTGANAADIVRVLPFISHGGGGEESNSP